MQENNDRDKSPEISPSSKIVDNGEPVALQAMGKFLEGIVEPIVRGTKVLALGSE